MIADAFLHNYFAMIIKQTHNCKCKLDLEYSDDEISLNQSLKLKIKETPQKNLQNNDMKTVRSQWSKQEMQGN